MPSYLYESIRENDRLPVRFDFFSVAQSAFPAHWHKYIEILYILSGTMEAIVQGEAYRLLEKDILVVNSEDIHMTKTFDERTEYILLQIPENQLQRYFPDVWPIRFQTVIPQREEGTQQEPGVILLEMLELYRKKEEGYLFLFLAKLYELLYCLCRNYTVRHGQEAKMPGNRNYQVIAEMTDWLCEHYRDPIGLDEAAARAGYSREYFCRIFKKCTGQTLFEYLQEIRAMKLHEELCSSDESITNLMEKHGITNYKTFLNVFRRLYGDTPCGVRQGMYGSPSLGRK